MQELPPVTRSPQLASSEIVVDSRQNLPSKDENIGHLARGVNEWLVPSAFAADAGPPTQEEIKLLREAFATFYGVDRDLQASETLLSKVIDAWQRQPPGTTVLLHFWYSVLDNTP